MSSTSKNKSLMDRGDVDRMVKRIAADIVSDFSSSSDRELYFIGIQTRGIPLAERLADLVGKAKLKVEVGTLDISMYRDDIGLRKFLPAIRETRIPFDINDKNIILVDDVLYTGRTIRAALDAVNDYGRPRLIRLAVLVDRGLREYPIFSDYTGERVDVPQERRVKVKWMDTDDEEGVFEVD